MSAKRKIEVNNSNIDRILSMVLFFIFNNVSYNMFMYIKITVLAVNCSDGLLLTLHGTRETMETTVMRGTSLYY